MPISRLFIVNQARGELGRLPVTSVQDSEDTIFLDAKIDVLLPVLLQETRWDFAIKYREDNTPITQPFTPDFTNTYQLPSDYGQMFSWGNFNQNFGSAGTLDFFISDGLISTDIQPISYYYIVNDVDVIAVSIMFCRALAIYIASDSCLALTENQNLDKKLLMKYEEMRSKAVNRNDMERYIKTKPNNDYDRVLIV